jgi:hypothetical protein
MDRYAQKVVPNADPSSLGPYLAQTARFAGSDRPPHPFVSSAALLACA